MSHQPSHCSGVSRASAPSHRLPLAKGRGLLLPTEMANACLLTAWCGYKKLLWYFSRTLLMLPRQSSWCRGTGEALSACRLCLGTAGMQDKQSIFPKPHIAAQEAAAIKG